MVVESTENMPRPVLPSKRRHKRSEDSEVDSTLSSPFPTTTPTKSQKLLQPPSTTKKPSKIVFADNEEGSDDRHDAQSSLNIDIDNAVCGDGDESAGDGDADSDAMDDEDDEAPEE